VTCDSYLSYLNHNHDDHQRCRLAAGPAIPSGGPGRRLDRLGVPHLPIEMARLTARVPFASVPVMVEGWVGLPLYRTDEHGVVEEVSHGAQVWVEERRSAPP
jgi:hypothetical protein